MRTDHGQLPGSGRSLRRWRTAALLAVGVAIGVAVTATPVSGHIGSNVAHLWNAHIKPKTDARYYTKAQARARFAPRGAKAADAELLDGLDSTQFVQGNGRTVGGARALPPLGFQEPVRIDGVLSVAYLCPSSLASNGQLTFFNLSGSDANVFVESGGTNPTYSAVAGQGRVDLAAAASGDSFHIQAQGSFGVATIEAASVHRAADCHVQAQVVITR